MEYPVYYLELESGELKYGLQDIALVDDPAIQSNFMKWSAQVALSKDALFNFSVQNEEQRIVTGAVMIPDKLIYREVDSKPFYVTATKETIFEAAQKWGKENRNNNIKLSHDATDTTPDVFMFESFVTDENRVTSVKGFEDLPVGTWFITCKVLSDQVWSDIKSGVFNGFSLEALFKMTPAATLTDEEIQAIQDIIK